MEIKDKATPRGIVDIWIIDPVTLRVRRHRRQQNLIVDTGRPLLAARFTGSGWPLNRLAVGTGNTAAAVTDLALETELARADLVRQPWRGIGAESNRVYARATFGIADAVGTITEAGLFYNSIMFSRVIIDPGQAKADGELMVCNWTIIF
jgi:hypothetical protein